ncbi:MAG: hypothetical protein AB1299_07400 [Thermoproteota archaeon]|nr:hypothetical protein [Candidatus Nitrosotenuis sp.]
MSRYRYWKITADEISKASYDQNKVLNWEIKGIKEPEDQAIFIGVFLYRYGTPMDYTPIKGIAFYHNNVEKSEVDEVTKFLKGKFGGESKEKNSRVFLEGSKEIYSGEEIGKLAKEMESKFKLRATISIEFQDITEEERKKSGLADAKLLPIPGKH